MFYSYVVRFFSVKFRERFGQAVLSLVRKIVSLVFFSFWMTCSLLTLDGVGDSSLRLWSVTSGWAQAKAPSKVSQRLALEETVSSKAPLSDLIPVDAPYAFGYDPIVTGQSSTSFTLGTLSEWWNLVRDRAQEQEMKWTEEEREAWRSFSTLPLPKSPQEWSEMGLEQMPRFWVYGLGLTPALVLELSSPDRFKKWMQREVDASHLGFEERAHSNGPYWRKRLKRWTLLARLSGRYIHFAMIPQAAEPVLLSFFLRKRHTQTLTPRLRKALAELPPGARGSGLIQLNFIIDLFFGSQRPLLKYSGEALGLPNSLFASCEADLRAIGETLPKITLGLSSPDTKRGTSQTQSSSSSYRIYTHLEIADDLVSRLKRAQNNAQAIWTPLMHEEALGVGMRFNVRDISSIFSDLGKKWRETPWSCRPLKGLNHMMSFTEDPQYQAGISMLGDLNGLTFQISQETRNITSQNVGTRQGTMFTGWVELIHPHAPLLLQLMYSSITKKSLPPQYATPNRVLHDLSSLFPHLSAPLLSLHPDRVMMSMGIFGREAHQKLSVHEPSEPTSNPPLLWVDIPPKLSAWVQQRFSSGASKREKHDDSHAQGSSRIKKIRPLDLPKKSPELRNFKINLSGAGIMIESTLVVKSL